MQVRGTCVGAVSGTIPEAEFYAQHGKDHVLEVPPYALEHFSKVMEYYNGENWTIASTCIASGELGVTGY